MFKNGINKSKQKEASLIVSSLIKSAKSNYAIKAYLPNNIGELTKFADFEKCDANRVEIDGHLACKNRNPVKVKSKDNSFFSPSGNYKIDLISTEINNQGQMFMVKANPNGNNFVNQGSAVVGCFSPFTGVTIIKEYSSKKEKRMITENLFWDSDEDSE